MAPGRVIPFTKQSRPHPEASQPQQQMVVLIGKDPELLRLRAQILGYAGYTVHYITPDQVTPDFLKTRTVQLWVFCQTLEFHESAVLAAAIRSTWPEDKVLRLSGRNDIRQAPELFDESLHPVMGVDDLLRVVGTLVKQSSSSN